MGKVAAAAGGAAAGGEMMKKKKKGRPSLLDLQRRSLEQQKQQQQLLKKKTLINSNPNFQTPTRRSTRHGAISPSDELIEDDDDDERREKKVKLVVRLPQSNQQHYTQKSSSLNSDSGDGYDSNAEGGDNHEAFLVSKRRKINAVADRSDDEEVVPIATDQDVKAWKAIHTQHGSPLESGPTTPLPDKKLLVFILDRLQKKDTYGVFSEPVDPNELPDYHEIIEHPMDFGTLRRKLDDGFYANLEQLEADVFLICSNAMQYNSSDTIYFRQARSIQELAKRDFENLRQEGDDGELQPKVVRRGRPPKNLKKPVGRPPLDRVAPELSSGATLATGEDNVSGSNAYNLRRAPTLHRFQSTDASINSHRTRNGENYSEWLTDWNDEFPASILKADMKYGKKQFLLDETRRDTYKQFHPSVFGDEPSMLSNLNGDAKQLMPVGLHAEHGYARSLARFAANLGPVVWKVASKKLENVLPTGLKFGPGLGAINEVLPQQPSFPPEKLKSLNKLACDNQPSRPVAPSTSGVKSVVAYKSPLQGNEDIIQADRGLNTQSEFAEQESKPLLLSDRNGLNGMYNNIPSQMMVQATFHRSDTAPPNRINPEAQKLSESPNTVNPVNLSASDVGPDSRMISDAGQSGKPSWQVVSEQRRDYSLPVPPDLNVRFQGPTSPSSGLRINSPQQPDLALQL